ncbi:MAG: hypothetical protein EXR71_16590 [Myxococcales bacterium]|nr:hypothetical protein [Myxococcales bacterium]
MGNLDEAAQAVVGVGRPYDIVRAMLPRPIELTTLLSDPDQPLPNSGHVGTRMAGRLVAELDPRLTGVSGLRAGQAATGPPRLAWYASAMFLALFGSISTVTCEVGTHLEGGECVADASPPEGDAGPCTPPDAFWGAVPADLATRTPYVTSYDGGLAEVWPNMPTSGSLQASQTWHLVEVTVAQPEQQSGDPGNTRWYTADGNWAIGGVPWNAPAELALGDRLSFTTRSFTAVQGERRFEQLTDARIVSSENAVYVRELAAEPLDYHGRGAEFVRVHGLVGDTLAHDCGVGYHCFELDHDGTIDVVRVKDDNVWDL